MPQKIAEYRVRLSTSLFLHPLLEQGPTRFTAAISLLQESRKLKNTSLLDQLLLTPKERRMKQFRTPN